MDFSRSLYDKCSFCNDTINDFYVSCLNCDCKFCDIACAKLYYDNVDKVKINLKDYNTHYVNGQLSSTESSIFEKVATTSFYMLPIYKIGDDIDRNVAKQNYQKMLLMMKK